MTIQKVLDSL